MTRDKLNNILDELTIDDVGEFKENKYIITLNDSEEYAYYYSILDHNDELYLVDSSSVSTEYINVCTYEGSDYKVSLNADFNKNYYNITIEDLK